MKKRSAAVVIGAMIAVLLILTIGVSAADQAARLTVEIGSNDYEGDLKAEGLLIDVYRVGVQKPEGGIAFDEAFGDLAEFGELSEEELAERVDELGQEAAKIALAADTKATPRLQGWKLSEPTEDLEPALYLVLAYGSDIQEKSKTVTREDKTESFVTIAHSDRFEYRFLPVLVPVNGNFDQEPKAVLKPEQADLYGQLKIVKELLTYDDIVPVTFVFSVEGELNGENVLSDVAAVTLSKAGTGEARIKHIPAGTEVTVKEIYSGAQYDDKSEEPVQTVTVEAGEEAEVTVTFTNDHNENETHSSGIINHFESLEHGGWGWYKDGELQKKKDE